MTTLYRSPTVILGDFEWHLAASNRGGRVSKQFYFRPLAAMRYRWEPITKWRDRLPEQFSNRFQTYRLHAINAIEREKKRPALVLQRERQRVVAA